MQACQEGGKHGDDRSTDYEQKPVERATAKRREYDEFMKKLLTSSTLVGLTMLQVGTSNSEFIKKINRRLVAGEALRRELYPLIDTNELDPLDPPRLTSQAHGLLLPKECFAWLYAGPFILIRLSL